MQMVTKVSGTVITQYIQKRDVRTLCESACQSNMDIENKEAINVPGRNTTVTAAKVFIDEESLLLARAIMRESFASPMLRLVSSRLVRLKSYPRLIS